MPDQRGDGDFREAEVVRDAGEAMTQDVWRDIGEAAQTGRLVSETDGGERAAQEVTALVAEIDSLGIGRIVR